MFKTLIGFNWKSCSGKVDNVLKFSPVELNGILKGLTASSLQMIILPRLEKILLKLMEQFMQSLQASNISAF